MRDFIAAFAALNQWLRRYDIRGQVRVKVEFDTDREMYLARDHLKTDFTSELQDYMTVERATPQTCYGIPFELTFRRKVGQ